MEHDEISSSNPIRVTLTRRRRHMLLWKNDVTFVTDGNETSRLHRATRNSPNSEFGIQKSIREFEISDTNGIWNPKII